MAYNSKIEFEIQLRADITSFVRRCDAAYRRITKMKAPYCFLTHWFYYQLARPFESSDIFIRDIDSKRSKELLRELVVIAMKSEVNADFVVSAILNEAKTYLKKRASASRELTNSSTEEIAKIEVKNSSTEEIAKIEDKKTDSSKTAKRQPISLTALASFELKDEYKPDISAFIARSLAPPEHKQEQLEVIKDSIVYHRLKYISVKATEQTEFGKPSEEVASAPKHSESRESRSKSDSVKATRRMRDRLKNMYKKPISEIEFLADAFCMLYRYETLNLIAKETMQLSAPDFEYLSLLKIGFQLECFASPINSHLKYFCSAFKDTDECFGSLGSFFELSDEYFDKDLKCTCDTPYQLDAIELNVDKVISILDKYSSKRKLEFRFILPYWADADYVQKLKDTKYQTSYEIKESYSYVLHKASTDEKKSIVPCATLRVTLQSK